MRTVFIDTNILIYARDQGSPEKAEKARAWIEALGRRNELVVSLQVINEFVAVSSRRFASVALTEIHARAQALLNWCHAPFDAPTALQAMAIRERYRVSWWDALIVSSAVGAGCRYILSEDLQAGTQFGPVAVVDPFRTDIDFLVTKN